MASTIDPLEKTRLKNGSLRYRIVVRNEALGRIREFKGADKSMVLTKARHQAEDWDNKLAADAEKARKRREREQAARDVEARVAAAEQATQEADEAWQSLQTVLAHTIDVDDKVEWNSLKSNGPFLGTPPKRPSPKAPPQPAPLAERPDELDEAYQDRPGCVGQLIDLVNPSGKARRRELLDESFRDDLATWSSERATAQARMEQLRAQVEDDNKQTFATYQRATQEWEARKAAFVQEQAEANAAVDALKLAYDSRDPNAIEEYCNLVLDSSEYPDWAAKEWDLRYLPEARMCVVEYALPAPDSLPSLKRVSYVKSRDEFKETYHSASAMAKAFDSVCYQTALRTIHELFEADTIGALEVVTFNGVVEAIDPGTGRELKSCLLSVQTERQAFMEINLSAVDPKACFRKLRGVGSSKLHSLSAVRPVLELPRDDDRFTESYAVASTLDEGENLAAMDWEDFEHLVREVFEREFAAGGAEVRVTRASRDGGIDAVIFDPDPLRGGKMVIQAKRYTRTVGVSAVRDLFGTMQHEGAMKGILVTTAPFGPDSYAFAKDKPITLIDGGQLLHLCQKHKFNVTIDVQAARESR